MREPSEGFQNKLEPQTEQNPLSACCEAEYHLRLSSPWISLKFSDVTAVAATAYPVQRAH
jgi:hypothetical protein